MTNNDLDSLSGTSVVVRDLTDSYDMDVDIPNSSLRLSSSAISHTGLSSVSTLKDEKDLASVVSSLVGERFSFAEEKVLQLRAQLEIYFSQASILDEEMLSIMTNQGSWPLPRSCSDPGAVDMVTIPVTMCMANIARYTEVALAKGFYMTKIVKYNDLVEFYGATKSAQKSRSTSAPSPLPTESKVPIFKVPAFSGDTLKGDIYEREVVSILGTTQWRHSYTREPTATIILLGLAPSPLAYVTP